MKERRLNALLLLDATNIIYTVGYFHLSTERPLAALIPESGDPVMFVPGLEVDQVRTWWVKDYESYFDFPGPVNRVRWIFERVAKRGFDRARIGIEEPRPSRLHQISLGAPKAKIVVAGDLVDDLRLVKDEDEVRIMRRAMTYADFKVQAGREFVQHNGSVTEDEILKVTADAVADRMSKELNDVVGVGIDPPLRRSGAPLASVRLFPMRSRARTG
jgi:Xaa-Pro dipeptidase